MPLTYPARVVDVHAHCFNARQVPLNAFLERRGVPPWLAGPVRDLLNSLTGTVHLGDEPGLDYLALVTGTDDIPAFAEALARAAARKITAGPRAKAAFATAGRRRDVGPAHSALALDPLYSALERIEALRLEEEGGPSDLAHRDASAPLAPVLSDAEGLARAAKAGAVADWLLPRFRETLRWLLERLRDSILGDAYGIAMDYLRFLLLMLCDEERLLSALLSGYRPEQNVALVLLLMVDMEHGFGERPHEAFDTANVKRVGALVERSAGRAAAFVAFDPRRSRPDGLEIVTHALAHGASGVKVYPPLGFRAYGEDREQRRRLELLYSYCQRERIPILTRCSAVGFEANPGDGLLSDPGHWQPVLDWFPGLVLAYGHAGGGGVTRTLTDPPTGDERDVVFPGWYSADPGIMLDRDPNNYAVKVVDHCRSYPNVYCDFSHLPEILNDGAERGAFVANLEAACAARTTARHPFAFSTKAMYGLDWHMPTMALRAADYLDCLVDIFDRSEILRPHKGAFFGRNAATFLAQGREPGSEPTLRVDEGSSTAQVSAAPRESQRARTARSKERPVRSPEGAETKKPNPRV